jgi:hypothetical protein
MKIWKCKIHIFTYIFYEIISSLYNQSENEKIDDSSSDESTSTPKEPSSVELFAIFKIVHEWFKKLAEHCPTQLLFLRSLQDLASEKHLIAFCQIKTDSFIKKKKKKIKNIYQIYSLIYF